MLPPGAGSVVQTAVRLVIEPLFEADFQDCSYGYRPKRSAVQASPKVYKWLNYGLVHVVDVDLESYFDRSPMGDCCRCSSDGLPTGTSCG